MKKLLVIFVVFLGSFLVVGQKTMAQPGKIPGIQTRLDISEKKMVSLIGEVDTLFKLVGEAMSLAQAQKEGASTADLKRLAEKIQRIQNRLGELEGLKNTSFNQKLKEVVSAKLAPEIASIATEFGRIRARIDAVEKTVEDIQNKNIEQGILIDASFNQIGEAAVEIAKKQQKILFGVSTGTWVSRWGLGGGVGPDIRIPLNKNWEVEFSPQFGVSPSLGLGYSMQFAGIAKITEAIGFRLGGVYLGDLKSLQVHATTLGIGPGLDFKVGKNTTFALQGFLGVGRWKDDTHSEWGGLFNIVYFFE